MMKYWSVYAKYRAIFKISFQQEFAYRLNFVMWRVRNVLQIFLVFFLWSAVFTDPTKNIFGYDRTKILTYVFGVLIVRAIVLSSRAVDVTNEIVKGDITNYFLKPINYFKYWLTRDIASKILNLSFATVEFSILYVVLKPQIFVQTNIPILFIFFLSLLIAVFLFFVILFIISAVPFWAPELGWGAQFFVLLVITEFLTGALFPIDILPKIYQDILYLTPFPYLIFFPLELYLGKIQGLLVVKGITISLVWVFILWFSMKSIWAKGVKVYRAEGR